MPAASTQLASSIQDEIIKFTYAVLRGIKDESFRVIRGNQAPAVLVEIGVISKNGQTLSGAAIKISSVTDC